MASSRPGFWQRYRDRKRQRAENAVRMQREAEAAAAELRQLSYQEMPVSLCVSSVPPYQPSLRLPNGQHKLLTFEEAWRLLCDEAHKRVQREHFTIPLR